MCEGTGVDGAGRVSGAAVRTIVIIGGGTAGWMVAAYLAHRLAHLRLQITVVDSAAIGTVGVGEASVPAIRDFFAAIGLSDEDVLRATGGTIKYGIRFDGWGGDGHSFFHPFGLYGASARGVPFHQLWLRARRAGAAGPLSDYCLATQLALGDRFLAPAVRPANDLGVFDYAVHLDAVRFAALLRRRALADGATHVDGTINGFDRDERGGIAAARLRGGERIEGDLWIDCSGFRSIALGVPFEDWTRWLPCDRAIPTAGSSRRPFTTATARPAGWQWHIPLNERTGNGYVYASDCLTDGAAEAALIASLDAAPLTTPNRLRFTPGRRSRTWEGNVVALGLAAGFLEPLESTSISLIQSGLERLVALFPGRHVDPRLAATYNHQSALEMERIRDFLVLHYLLNGRHGEPFWDRMRAANPGEHLRAKLDAWHAGGAFVRHLWETFHDPSWLSMYAGFDTWPAAPSVLAAQFDDATLADALSRMRIAVTQTCANAPPHAEVLARVHAR